ncbi:hypothetical protein, partial [Streptomyces vietnamensis]|uniref:hypothetical protein n=4 Tax=Actinomycetota TaxID=201174 RepID=UPI003445B2DE
HYRRMAADPRFAELSRDALGVMKWPENPLLPPALFPAAEPADKAADFIDIVFDGPPAAQSGRFVEVENPSGASIKVGEWIERDGGRWALRIRSDEPHLEVSDRVNPEAGHILDGLIDCQKGHILTTEEMTDVRTLFLKGSTVDPEFHRAKERLRPVLFPETEPAEPVVPNPEHPYFVWEQGYQAAVTDSDAGVDGTRGNAYTSNPYSLGESEPDPATEPAEEVKPIGWYRAMTRKFATAHFGFPEVTGLFERTHTASDGGVWGYCGGEWELREYPPAPAEPSKNEAETETEWAIEFPGGICNISFDPADPEEMLQWVRDGKLVCREVTTGPWIDAVPAPAEPAEEETKEDGPGKFRKKPVEVEAMQYDGKDWRSIAQWMAVDGAPMGRTASGLLRIHTLEGEMAAHPGDWIIKGTQGEFYPCKPASFADTFEAASSPIVPAPTEASVIGGAAGALRAALAVVDPHEAGPWEHAWLSVRDLEDCARRAEALATTDTEWPSLDAVPAHVRTVRDKVGDEYRRVENGGWDFRSSEWQTIISPTADYDEFAPFVAVEEQDR